LDAPGSYYATALHELTHWTKHERRVDRDFGRQKFGDAGYAREELVAELGAAFLCADLGITPEIREDHAAYLGHWLNVLKEDKRAIFSTVAHAQRAADFLNSLQPQQQEEAPRPDAPRSGTGLWPRFAESIVGLSAIEPKPLIYKS